MIMTKNGKETLIKALEEATERAIKYKTTVNMSEEVANSITEALSEQLPDYMSVMILKPTYAGSVIRITPDCALHIIAKLREIPEEQE